MRNTHPEKALSEAHKSLDDIRSEMLAWQAQYSDIRKELKEVKGTSDTLRVKQARVAKCVMGTLRRWFCLLLHGIRFAPEQAMVWLP